jgi:glyoxylase-like metal-dependent hydrolase (beta-lactamase superfamily II)
MNRRDALKAMSCLGGLALSGGTWGAQAPTAKPAATRPAGAAFLEAPIKTQELAPGLFMLSGPGGNIAIMLHGESAAVIDSAIPQRATSVLAAITELGGKQVRFLLNTHWHFDHVGGNEAFARSGAVIVAHHRTRSRMATEQNIAFMKMKVPPSPESALPVITFGESETLHHGKWAIEAVYVPGAHTDTDVAFRMPGVDLVHAGDLFFNGIYPFIDYSTGGNLHGLVSGLGRVLDMVGPETRVIPGHGPLARKPELQAYRDMLAEVRDRVNPLVESGKSIEEVVAAKPTRELDEEWAKGFLNGDMFVQMLYQGMKK